MGFTPVQVNELSPWQWAASVEGYIAANASEEDRKSVLMSEEEFAAAEKMLEG